MDAVMKENNALKSRNVELMEEIRRKQREFDEYLHSVWLFEKTPFGERSLLSVAANIVSKGLHASAMKQPGYGNVFDMETLRKYDHHIWIQTACPSMVEDQASDVLGINHIDHPNEFCIDASGFMVLMNMIVRNLTVMTTNQASAKARPSSDNTDPISRARVFQNPLPYVQMLSVMFSAANPEFVSPLALSLQLVIKSHTNSTKTISLVGKALPGGVSSSYLNNRIAKAVSNVGELKMNSFPHNCDAVLVADNCSVDYKQGTSENVKGGMKSAIWCNTAAIAVFMPPDCKILQTNPLHAPLNWKPLDECSPQVVEFGHPSFPRDEGSPSHEDLVLVHRKLYLSDALQAVSSRVLPVEPVNPVGNVTTPAANQAHKVCPGCGKQWSTRKQSCNCVSNQPLKLVDHGAPKHATTFRSRASHQDPGHSTNVLELDEDGSVHRSKSARTNEYSSGTQGQRLLEKASSAGDYDANTSSSSDKRIDAIDPQYVSISKNKRVQAVYHPLHALPYNPGSKAGSEAVFKELSAYMNIFGELPEGKTVDPNAVRFYVDAFGDAGLYADFDKPKIVMWMGQFHIFKNFMEQTYKILDVLFDVIGLGKIWGFESPRSLDYLYSCSNMKKSFAFIREGLISAMLETLCSSFCKHCRSSGVDPTVEGLLEFASDPSDPTFQANVQLLFDVLLPLDLMKNALRKDCMDSFDAARLKLLPLCFAMNNRVYGPRHVQEIVLLYQRVTDEVRKRHREFFSFDGKGIDERMEEHNRAQLRMLADQAPTLQTVRNTSLLLESINQLSDMLRKSLSISDNRERDRERTHIDQSINVAAMVQHLESIAAFCKVEGRTSFNSFRGKSKEFSVHDMLAYGEQHLKTWTSNYLSSAQHQVFPKPLVDFKSYTEEAFDEVEEEGI